MVGVVELTLTTMKLEMYLNNKLIDSLTLSLHKINDAQEKEAYIQGAIKHMLEIWEDLIKDQDVKPAFFIRTTSLRWSQ
mgnify:FL=1